MIISADSEYKATKRIKLRKEQLVPPFDELAAWISLRWNVTVLNVIYDRRNDLHGPRVQVVLEHRAEAQVFRDGVNFDKSKQHEIASQFIKIVKQHAAKEFDVDGLFVVFSAFAPLALEEADDSISDNEIEALKKRLNDPALWAIHRCFGHVTFMFYTDAQVKERLAKGKQAVFAESYCEILKIHDQFGYLAKEAFTVAVDSKQNFDKKFGGSWFNYDR